MEPEARTAACRKIGDWLREAREARGWGRPLLARLCQEGGVKMTPKQLQTFECTAGGAAARSLPSTTQVLALADSLGCDSAERNRVLGIVAAVRAPELVVPAAEGGPVRIVVSGGNPGEADAVVAVLPAMMRARGLTAQAAEVTRG